MTEMRKIDRKRSKAEVRIHEIGINRVLEQTGMSRARLFQLFANPEQIKKIRAECTGKLLQNFGITMADWENFDDEF